MRGVSLNAWRYSLDRLNRVLNSQGDTGMTKHKKSNDKNAVNEITIEMIRKAFGLSDNASIWIKRDIAYPEHKNPEIRCEIVIDTYDHYERGF